MKLILLNILLLCLTTVYGQKINKKYTDFFPEKVRGSRIKYSEFFNDRGRLVFKYNYKYDKSGLLKSRVRKHYIDGQWLPLETQKYEYDVSKKMVICRYVPSTIRDGSLDLAVKKLEQDIDTIIFDNRKVIYHSRYVIEREKGRIKRRFLHTVDFLYEGENLTSIVTKRSEPKSRFPNYVKNTFIVTSEDGLIIKINEEGGFELIADFEWKDKNIQKISRKYSNGGTHTSTFSRLNGEIVKMNDGGGDYTEYNYENAMMKSAVYFTDYGSYKAKLTYEAGIDNETLMLGEYHNLNKVLEELFLPYSFLLDDISKVD